MLALSFGGCAGPGGPGALTGDPVEPAPGAATMAVESQEIAPTPAETAAAPVSGPASATRQPASGSRAAPRVNTGKPKELPYPNFGTPAQIGETPVLTNEQRSQMQTDLETMAREREAKARRELEEEDQGQP